ncbi:MAG: DNA polymerase III subunit delta [Heliobacteriaceae bacterium]|jgi:DNA polymerase-3 subunit delta|nr:DNA polymerase III subunit delta [Heliobacteriaceae bacterium]
MAVYFFYGEEEFNIEKEIGKFKKKLDPNFLEMSYQKYNNPRFADFIAALRSRPMMFGAMLLVIDILGYFSAALEDNQIKEISCALEDNSEDTDIILTAILPRGEGKKLDSRKKLFKLLSKYNAREFAPIPSYKTAELGNWINKQGKGIKLTPEAVNALISQAGNNLRQIDAELDKLQLYAYPKNTVTPDMVREICISEEDLFAFSDFLMQNEKDKALLEYRKLLDKKYPLEIVSTLQNMLRKWILLKSNKGRLSAFELSKQAGMHEYAVKLTMQKLGKITLKELVKLKQNITDAEYRIKSGLVADVENEIENAVIFR